MKMRQELIDLALGEMEANEAAVLRERIQSDPALKKEFTEICALRSFLSRREEVEAGADVRAAVVAAAAAQVAPSLWERVVQIPGLIRYRFRHSVGFRAAAIALAVHLVVTGILLNVHVRQRAEPGHGTVSHVHPPLDPDQLVVAPSRDLVLRLRHRREPQAARLKAYGVEGQRAAIRRGIDRLLASQDAAGGFGSVDRTAHGALVLLGEGHSSTAMTRHGVALRRARARLLDAARSGSAGGAALTALVEDYALSYDHLRDEERREYALAIHGLIAAAIPADAAWSEGLMLAHLADFAIPANKLNGPARVLLRKDRSALLRSAPDRLAVAALLARGRNGLARAAVRDWARPLFDGALKDLGDDAADPRRLLDLQSPYRF